MIQTTKDVAKGNANAKPKAKGKPKAKATPKSEKKANHVLEAHRGAQKEYAISNVFNRCAKKTNDGTNFLLLEWRRLRDAMKDDGDYKNDIEKFFFKAEKGYVILTNHFLKRLWDKERNTAKKGVTWNLYTNVVINKGKCSTWFWYGALRNIATMDSNEFNSIYNFGLKHKPKAVATA